MKLAYAVSVSAAAIMLCRVVWARRPLKSAQPRQSGPEIENYEYACGVLFMMIVPPYFIAYDQTLTALPLVMLWSSPAWRWGLALFAVTTAPALDLALVLGVNFGPLAALATMFFLVRAIYARDNARLFRPASLTS